MMQRWEKYQSSLITASRILSVLLAVVPLLILYLLFSVEVGPNADATEIYVRNLSSVFAYVVMGFFFDFFYLVHTDRYLLFMKPLRITTVILAIAGIIKALISLYYLIIYLFNGNIVLWFYVGEFLIWTVVAFFAFFYSQRLKE